MGAVDHLFIFTRQVWPLFVLAAVVVVVSKLGALGSPALDRTVVTMLVNLIVVIGLFLFVGVSGVFSFGHISFMAIGAYAAGIFTIPTDRKEVLLTELPGFLSDAHLDSVPASLVGGAVAAGVAIAVAVPLMRLSGLVAALGTFAFLLIVNVVARAWTDITNGTRGMSAIPVTTSVDRALVFALVAMALAFLYLQSRFGRRLAGSREDEPAARASGVHVARERGMAFILSAFVVGVAGGLFAQSLGSIAPAAFFLEITFLTIAMLVIGGITSLSGAVIGTIVISAIAEFLRRVETGFDIGSARIDAPAGLRDVGLGVLMLLILVLRPRGITGGREITWPVGPWELEWRTRGSARRPPRQGSGQVGGDHSAVSSSVSVPRRADGATL